MKPNQLGFMLFTLIILALDNVERVTVLASRSRVVQKVTTSIRGAVRSYPKLSITTSHTVLNDRESLQQPDKAPWYTIK